MGRNINLQAGSGIILEVVDGEDDLAGQKVIKISVGYTPGTDPAPVGAAGTFTVDATNDLKISNGASYVVVGTQS
jgi:hypothetical protein